MREIVVPSRLRMAIALLRRCGYANPRVNEYLLESKDDAGSIQDANQVLMERGVLSTALDETDLEIADNTLRRSEQVDTQALEISDARYPSILRSIPQAPTVLFVRGALSILDRLPGLAVVGSRQATANGREIARRLSMHFAEAGWPIVSGLALGIDAAAHEGALQASQGLTIAVLAHGLHKASPKANALLADRILEAGGAWVSEYPPGKEPRKEHFVPRNRIQAGLSAGSVIVEGGRHSGSMTQAQFCIEQGRRLFAVVPAERSNPLGLYSNGPTELVDAGKAFAIKSSADYPSVMRELLQSKTRLLANATPELPLGSARRSA
jgi:DNA processing protein